MISKRQSNFELLRIISMVLIVFHHISVHGMYEFSNSVTLNKLWIQFIQLGGKIGVDVFVLISGYFLIDSKKIKISKVLKFWLQVFFYSTTIYFLFIIFGIEKLEIKSLIKIFLPINFDTMWFASTYFILYLISPYINKLVSNLTKVEYRNMLILFTILWCFIPTLSTTPLQSNNLIFFSYLYMLAGYLKKYQSDEKYKLNHILILNILTVLMTYGSAIIFDILGTKYIIFANHATYFYSMSSIPIVIISISLFIIFKNCKIKNNNLVNLISSATFGIYLIHDNPYMRKFLWTDLFNLASYTNSKFLIIYTVFVALLVYITCTSIELIRIYLIEKKYTKYLVKLESKIERIFIKLGYKKGEQL